MKNNVNITNKEDWKIKLWLACYGSWQRFLLPFIPGKKNKRKREQKDVPTMCVYLLEAVCICTGSSIQQLVVPFKIVTYNYMASRRKGTDWKLQLHNFILFRISNTEKYWASSGDMEDILQQASTQCILSLSKGESTNEQCCARPNPSSKAHKNGMQFLQLSMH